MSKKPSLTTEVIEETLRAFEHVCAVCGKPCPPEPASIVRVNRSKGDRAENLICLCPDCRRRANGEHWGEKILREYKRLPWIHRAYSRQKDPPPTTTVDAEIKMKAEDFHARQRRCLLHALAGFLEIPPEHVWVSPAREGSTKVGLRLPEKEARLFLRAFYKDDPDLTKCLAPVVLLGVSEGTRIVWLNRVRTQTSAADRREIEGALYAAYGGRPGLRAIVVCDKLRGYSTTEKPQVLSVELIGKCRSLPRIVKIGEVKSLQNEVAGWREIKDYLEFPDRLFVSLTDQSPEDRAKAVLEYDDASRVLSTSEVASLEEVVRRSCRWGSPPAATVAQMINHICDYMDRKLFIHARPLDENEMVWRYREKLKDPIETWWRDRVPLRRPILLRWGGNRHEFQDPVDWLNWLLSPAGAGKRPQCIAGPCHGDLHGRNVLIGLVRGEACYAALYDFEFMSRDGLIAWDLAKLEVELKVRILRDAVRSGIPYEDYLSMAVEFEKLLHAWTEKLDREAVDPVELPLTLSGNSLSHAPSSDLVFAYDTFSSDRSAGEAASKTCRYEVCPYESSSDVTYPGGWRRLFEILLEIRRCARTCLSGRERFKHWKNEYLFTLAAYSVATAKFNTYDVVQQELAYISGAVAAAKVELSNP